MLTSTMPSHGDIYGVHMSALVGHVRPLSFLDSIPDIEMFLQTLVGGLGMRIIGGPLTSTESGPVDRYGHSSVVLLAESHAAVHTYLSREAMFIDVFSCRAFETHTVYSTLGRFIDSFEIIEESLQGRGVHWSSDIHESLARWTRNRTDMPLSVTS